MSEAEPKKEKQDYGGVLDHGIHGYIARVLVCSGLFWGGILPLHFSYGVATVVFRTLALLSPKARRIVRDNLRQVVGDSVSEAKLNQLVKLNFNHAWARRHVDMAASNHFDREFVEKYVTIKGAEHYTEAAEKGKGVILVSFHIGSPFVAFIGVAPLLGPQVVASWRRIFDDYTSEKLRSRLAMNGAQIFDADFAYDGLMETLAQGRTIVTMADHMTSPRGIPVTYFGRETIMPAGAPVMAFRSGAEMIPCYAARTSKTNLIVEFGKAIQIPSRPEKIEEHHLVGVANQYIRFFEGAISTYPDQWESYFPMWPKSMSPRDIWQFTHDFGVMSEPPPED